MNKSWAYKWHGASANANVMQSEAEIKSDNNNGHIHFLCVYLNSFTAHCIIYLARLDFCHSINTKKKWSISLSLALLALLRDNNLWVCRCFMVRCMSVCAGALLLAGEHFKIIRLIYARARAIYVIVYVMPLFRFFSSFANLCLHTIIALIFILFAYTQCVCVCHRASSSTTTANDERTVLVVFGLFFVAHLEPMRGKWMRCRQWIAIAHIAAFFLFFFFFSARLFLVFFYSVNM